MVARSINATQSPLILQMHFGFVAVVTMRKSFQLSHFEAARNSATAKPSVSRSRLAADHGALFDRLDGRMGSGLIVVIGGKQARMCQLHGRPTQQHRAIGAGRGKPALHALSVEQRGDAGLVKIRSGIINRRQWFTTAASFRC
jgi:hypothetical protein